MARISLGCILLKWEVTSLLSWGTLACQRTVRFWQRAPKCLKGCCRLACGSQLLERLYSTTLRLLSCAIYCASCTLVLLRSKFGLTTTRRLLFSQHCSRPRTASKFQT